ncbi:ultraviolet-B receptor UVR8 isoform X3 [Amborella trichopoda]|uniref:ultraviolet-B receptor UVR8 isoform X3 n=1 Tax=Amborella trichopoda TaxID=13333 RepID=UPI0009BCFD7B|nr:ultraviolet-B receptor UVR8 isoform X3 [Amborella trichopoda]|eukprot:XP_020528714.1 ultraviolet-B receptor UVR8 isoform X3 [Amborella trichopoda]
MDSIPSQKVAQISVGEAHTLVLSGDGKVYSWGRGMFGRLGTGNEADQNSPVLVGFERARRNFAEGTLEMAPKFVAVASGAYHSLALQDDGSLWSWGYNYYGQLGHDSGNTLTPHVLNGFSGLKSIDDSVDEPNTNMKEQLKVSSIKAGGMMSLAIDSLGNLWIWGNCPFQLDKSNTKFSLVSIVPPKPVLDFHGRFVHKVACGNEHVVALVGSSETSKDLLCYSWGNNNHGQLGLGDTERRSHPELVKTFGHDSPWMVCEVACGAFHTAILTQSKAGIEGRLSHCWTFGLGDNGQLGHGTTKSTSIPETLTGLPQDALLKSLDCGLFHTCVVSETGDVFIWGMERGLGLCPNACFTGNDAGDALTPVRMICEEDYGPRFRDPIQLACGAAHTVLVANGGSEIWTWGRGTSGILGTGNTGDSFLPCRVIWPEPGADLEEKEKEKEKKEIEPPEGDSKEKERNETVEKVSDELEGDKIKELEKKLAMALDEVQLLRSKLSVMESYINLLHFSIFGESIEKGDVLSTLQNVGIFDVEREWEKMLESASHRKLGQLEAFYRTMLAGVKDKLIKRRIQELLRDCFHSLSTGGHIPSRDDSVFR